MKLKSFFIAYCVILVAFSFYAAFVTGQKPSFTSDSQDIIKPAFLSLPYIDSGGVWPYLHLRKGYPPTGTVYISIVSSKQVGLYLDTITLSNVYIDGVPYQTKLVKVRSEATMIGYKELFILIVPYQGWVRLEEATQAYFLIDGDAFILPTKLFSSIGKINEEHFPVTRKHSSKIY